MNVINILFYVSGMSIFLSILLFLLYSTFAYRLITPFTETVIKTCSFKKYFYTIDSVFWIQVFVFQTGSLLHEIADNEDTMYNVQSVY